MEKQEIKNKIKLLEEELNQITMQINNEEFINKVSKDEILKLISIIAEMKVKIKYLKND